MTAPSHTSPAEVFLTLCFEADAPFSLKLVRAYMQWKVTYMQGGAPLERDARVIVPPELKPLATFEADFQRTAQAVYEEVRSRHSDVIPPLERVGGMIFNLCNVDEASAETSGFAKGVVQALGRLARGGLRQVVLGSFRVPITTREMEMAAAAADLIHGLEAVGVVTGWEVSKKFPYPRADATILNEHYAALVRDALDAEPEQAATLAFR